MIRVSLFYCVCLLAIIPLSGCGGAGRPKLKQVTGTVTLDGAPLADATVVFQPVDVDGGKYQRPSRGTTDANGKFDVATYGTGDGLPLGKYNVGVQKREVVGELPEDFNTENEAAFDIKYKWVTPRVYADPATSGFTIEVTKSGLQPDTLALQTGGGPPEIESTRQPIRANEP